MINRISTKKIIDIISSKKEFLEINFLDLAELIYEEDLKDEESFVSFLNELISVDEDVIKEEILKIFSKKTNTTIKYKNCNVTFKVGKKLKIVDDYNGVVIKVKPSEISKLIAELKYYILDDSSAIDDEEFSKLNLYELSKITDFISTL